MPLGGFGVGGPVGGVYACPACIPGILGIPGITAFPGINAIPGILGYPGYNPNIGTFGAIPGYNPFFGTYPGICTQCV